MKKKLSEEIQEENKLKAYKRKKKENEKMNVMSLKKTLGIALIFIFSIIMLIFVCNRTFFKNNYKTSKLDIDIPRLMFFIKDDGNELVFKTYRKSQYVKDFFDYHLNNLTIYKCRATEFYYDDLNGIAIYSIDVKKGLALKTVTIKYAKGDADCLCISDKIGRAAEEFCKNK